MNKYHNGKKIFVVGIIAVLVLVIAGCSATNKSSHSTTTGKNSDHVKTEKKQTKKTSKNNQATNIQQIISKDLTGLSGTNSAYFYDLNSSQSAQYGKDQSQRAASDIKLFIMAAAYQQVADGKLNLDEQYTLTDADKVGGTGVLQQEAAGTKVSYRDLIKLMMTQSDNTASNIIIDKVGGLSAVNSEIKTLGSKNTVMKRKLMDTKELASGNDNLTSASDLGQFLVKLYRGKIVSKKYDQEMMNLLSQNTNHTKLPGKLASDVNVYNKTGEFGDYGVQNDAAILKQGDQAFVITVMSQNGTESEQISAMSNLGSDLANNIFKK